jgi:hypothetical protein
MPVTSWFNFEQEIPGNLLFNGNIGTRYVITETRATGFMTLAHTGVTAAYNPITNPQRRGHTDARDEHVARQRSKDWLPAMNLNLWAHARRTGAAVLPGQGDVAPARGQCAARREPAPSTNATRGRQRDQRQSEHLLGRVGNPGLLPFKGENRKHHARVVSHRRPDALGRRHYRNKIVTGAPINANIAASNLFAGSDAVDPVSGQPARGLRLHLSSYVNGRPGPSWDGSTRQKSRSRSCRGSSATPAWMLTTPSSTSRNFATSRDLMTGLLQPAARPALVSSRTSRCGTTTRKFNARVSYQGQSEFFDFISSCSNAINNYPTSFAQCPGQTIRTPYNPGGTNFREATEFLDLKSELPVHAALERVPVGPQRDPRGDVPGGPSPTMSTRTGRRPWKPSAIGGATLAVRGDLAN